VGVDLQTGERVAIKKMYLGKDANKVAREIEISRSLSHENILRTVHHEMAKFECIIVSEYVPFDLTDLLDSSQPLPRGLVRSLWNQLAEALLYLRGQGVLHRDLKPANILLTQAGQLKVADFGSAIRVADKGPDGKYPLEGFTRWYMAPDMLFGSRAYSFEVDLWSAGCILAELLEARPLFPGLTEIEQIFEIGKLMGSPDPTNWPQITSFPDHGKLQFVPRAPRPFSEHFKCADPESLAILQNLIRYQDRQLAKYGQEGLVSPRLVQKRAELGYSW
jgi:serine/threonine protein kinase